MHCLFDRGQQAKPFLWSWNCELGVDKTAPPFSARRKRGQRERQNARAILALASARNVLSRHHGGGSMAPSVGGRKARPKPGMWMCRCGGQTPLGTRVCPFCARTPPLRVTQPPVPSVRAAIPPSGPQAAGERRSPQRGTGAAASSWKQAAAAAPPWKQRERDEMERKLRELREENKRLEQRAAALQTAGAEDVPEGGADSTDPMAEYNRKRSKLAASETSLRETLGEEHAAVKAVQKELEELERQKPPLSKRSAEKKAATRATREACDAHDPGGRASRRNQGLRAAAWSSRSCRQRRRRRARDAASARLLPRRH